MRDDFDISDEEFERIIEPFLKELHTYIEKMMQDYAAFYLYCKFKHSAMWICPLTAHLNSAIDELCEADSFNIPKIKKILKDKYSLEIISEKPLQLKKTKKNY